MGVVKNAKVVRGRDLDLPGVMEIVPAMPEKMIAADTRAREKALKAAIKEKTRAK